MDTIAVIERYGPFQTGIFYRVVNRGYDWILAKCRGRAYYIPANFEKTVFEAEDIEEEISNIN